MKNRKTQMISLIALCSLIALSGCSSIAIKDSSVKGRSVKLSILNLVVYEHTTEEAVIGDAQIQKEETE